MKERLILLCPHCGKDDLHYPDIKGEYGWKDTTKLECYSCWNVFSAKPLFDAAKKARDLKEQDSK